MKKINRLRPAAGSRPGKAAFSKRQAGEPGQRIQSNTKHNINHKHMNDFQDQPGADQDKNMDPGREETAGTEDMNV